MAVKQQTKEEHVAKINSMILDLSWVMRKDRSNLNKDHQCILLLLETLKYDKDINTICKDNRRECRRLTESIEHYKKLYESSVSENKTLLDKIKDATTSSGLFISEVRRRLGI